MITILKRALPPDVRENIFRYRAQAHRTLSKTHRDRVSHRPCVAFACLTLNWRKGVPCQLFVSKGDEENVPRQLFMSKGGEGSLTGCGNIWEDELLYFCSALLSLKRCIETKYDASRVHSLYITITAHDDPLLTEHIHVSPNTNGNNSIWLRADVGGGQFMRGNQ